MDRAHWSNRKAIAALVALATLALAPAAGAATFTVDAGTDATDAAPGNGVCRTAGGACTLRAALVETNALPGADEVRLPARTYAVTGGALPITASLTLSGTGAQSTVIDAGGTNSPLTISGGGVVVVRGISLTGLSATASAVSIGGPDTTIDGVWIHDNESTTAQGGGIRIASGDVRILRSAVTQNSLNPPDNAVGGGIAIVGGNAIVESTTVAGNTAATAGVTARGGGISVMGGSAVLRHVTLLGNSVSSTSAAQYGGNLYTQDATALSDSIISGGQGANGTNCRWLVTAPALAGRNVYPGGASDNCNFPAGTVAGATAALTPLGFNGGFGWTAVPVAGSAALNAAAACPQDGRDQRGTPAPAGAACDIGAAEAGSDLRVTITPSAASVAPGEQITYVARVLNAGLDAAPATQLTFSAPVAPALVTPSSGSCAPPAACNLGTLPAGQAGTATVVLRAPVKGPLAVSATASAALPDPTPGDATAQLVTTVPAPARPVLSKLRAKGRWDPLESTCRHASLSIL